MFNSAYSTGGAACAVKTVESMTGIRMDHYVEVDFSGFEKLVDELGGVKVTTTKDIKDSDSHLNLKAGPTSSTASRPSVSSAPGTASATAPTSAVSSSSRPSSKRSSTRSRTSAC